MTFLDRLEAELDDLARSGSLRTLRSVEPGDGGAALCDGRRCFNLSGNDYLGVAGDAELAAEFRDRCPTAGFSAASSRLLTGNHPAYRQLEEELAAWYGGGAALVFNSGYHANIGILPALAGKGDLVLSDKLNHASIIDGLRLGAAEYRRYRHLDYAQLGEMLAGAAKEYRQCFIVSESIFSMDGDAADLAELARLKREYDAVLIVDEAHSAGVRGPEGRGLAAEQGVLDAVDVLIGTFGKAFGSTGAYAIMAPVVREYLVNTMRPLIFTTGLPPVAVEWSRFVLEKMPGFDGRRRRLAQLGGGLRRILRDRGCVTGGDSHIVPLMAGDNRRAEELARRFRERGILVFPIRPPTVPPGTARLRFSLTAALDDEALAAIDEVLA